MTNWKFAVLAPFILASQVTMAHAQDHPMGFFVTSTGLGDGANLGGLEGADAHCSKLAKAAAAKKTDWKAFDYWNTLNEITNIC